MLFAVLLTLVRFPPTTWRFTEEQGWHPQTADELAARDATAGPAAVVAVQPWDLTLAEAARNRFLYLIGVLFMLGLFGGLLAIGQLAAYAEEQLDVSAATAGVLVAVLAVGNGLGRPTSGWLGARLGVRRSMAVAYAVLACGLAVMGLAGSMAVAVPAAFVTGLAFGGALALTPIMVALLFGASYLARLYGLIFIIGFGIGGLLGGIAGGRLVEAADGSYTMPFLVAAALAVVAAVLVRTLLPAPGRERQHTPRSQQAFDEFVAQLAALSGATQTRT